MAETERNTEDGLWIDEDVAAYLRVSVHGINRLIKNRGLPVVWIGGLRRFRREDIEKWVADRAPKSETATADA